jgi:hypothetical protein
MKSWAEDPEIWFETQKMLADHKLKRCALCGAVNAASNSECFVCGWHGQFDYNPIQIEQGVHLLLDRCPELAQAMMERPLRSVQKKSWIHRLVTRLGCMFLGANNVRQ